MATNKSFVCNDVLQRIGYTIIDGVKVVQHVCTLSLSNPKDISIRMTKMDVELYKANRDVCREDFAKFEDAAYQLQEEYLAKDSAKDSEQ